MIDCTVAMPLQKRELTTIETARPFADATDLRFAVHHWADKLEVRVHSICIRAMTRKWASISTRGRLTLNSEVLTLPRDLAEFVVVHELVHLLAPNHGPVFKCFMSAYLPDWQKREASLRGYETYKK